uniref:L1 transposable element RRM domain-containing protein n=1 Tax=Oryzias latipes TaxID=8090 RepID=A0A3B3H8H7_ORYLA
MLSHFDAKLDTIHNSVHQMQDSLNFMKTTVGELEGRVGSNQDELSRLETRIKQLEKQNSYLAERVEDVENWSRASNIRLLRVPEGSEGRDMIGFVGQLLIQLFGQDKLPSPPVIERAHRSPGTPNPNPKAGPRPILVRFLHFQDKLNILRLSRDKKELLFKGNRVHIYPAFSAGFMEKRRLFTTVKKKLRDLDIEYAMQYPATLRVQVAGKRLFFRSPDEAEIFILQHTRKMQLLDNENKIPIDKKRLHTLQNIKIHIKDSIS